MIYEGGHPARREVWASQGMHIGLCLCCSQLSEPAEPRRCYILSYSECGCVSVPEARGFIRVFCALFLLGRPRKCQASVKETGSTWQSATNQLASCGFGWEQEQSRSGGEQQLCSKNTLVLFFHAEDFTTMLKSL